MVDIWRNWSEKEKQGFYACISVESDQKALQNLFGQFRKTIGRESTEKIKSLYYKALINVKRICDASGINLENGLPEPRFFEQNNFEITGTENSAIVKKDIRALSKHRGLFSVISTKNCMKALELAINSKPRTKSLLELQSLLKPENGETTCQFCGKIRKKWGSTFILKGVPDSLVVQLLPLNSYFHKALVRQGFNPRIELYTRSNRMLAEIIEHLKNKFNPAYIENSQADYTITLLAPWEGKLIEYSRNQEKITIGDVHLSLESPVPWQLYYIWKPVGTVFNEPSEHSYLSNSMFTMIEEQSNSLSFFQEPQKTEEKPLGNFKQLFSKPTHETFSKCEDDQKGTNSLKELHLDKSLTEFKEEHGESMFSAYFSFHKHPNC